MADMPNVPACFLRCRDVPNRISEFEVCNAMCAQVSHDSVYGCQRIGGVWRLYLRTIEARTNLINNQVELLGARVHVYNDNPFRAGIKDSSMEVVKITVKDWALSKDTAPLIGYFEALGVKLTSRIQQGKVRDPNTHKLSNWFNGDIILYSTPLPKPLSRYCYISGNMVRVFHKGQPVPEKLCTC